MITKPRRSFSFAALPFATFLLIACSGDSSVAPIGPPIKSMQSSATSISVAKGSSGSILFIIERRADFSGVVTMKVENVPTGVSAAFGPSSLGSTAVQSNLTITALPSAAEGTYTLTAVAAGPVASEPKKSITITLTVTTPGITLALSGSPATVVQGQNTTVPVTITRTGGFTASVGLSVSGLPTGVTASFAPVVLQSGQTASTLTLTASPTAPAGSSTVTVRAAAQGVTEQLVQLPLTVNASN